MMVTAYSGSKDELMRNAFMQRPHVVLLGAGASKAAFPNGDAEGRNVPVMKELVDVVPGLSQLLETAGFSKPFDDFESLYSDLAEREDTDLMRKVESLIEQYFVSLQLPNHPTIYDHLLLSLRPKDAVFTFNWDPFLFDAYVRNLHLSLPGIFFLHGNVRVGYCDGHGWGMRGERCPVCDKPRTPSPLRYPVKEKGHWYSKPYLKNQWESARRFLGDALIFTVFGYSAPTTDADAIELLKSGWRIRDERLVEPVEVVHKPGLSETEHDQLCSTWRPFVYFNHAHYHSRFEDSFLFLFPRRSCENLYYAGTEGIPSERFNPPKELDLLETQAWYAQIAAHEASHSASV